MTDAAVSLNELFHYRTDVINPHIPFVTGGSDKELEHLCKSFDGQMPDADQQLMLKRLTGCQTFGEFKNRLITSHHLVSQEDSTVMLKVDFREEGKEKLEIRAIIRTTGAISIAAVERTLDWGLKEALHERLVIHDRKWMNQGLASWLIQSQEEAWRAAGYLTIRLEAALDDGHIFWALQGFDFMPGEYEKVMGHLDTLMESAVYIGRTVDSREFDRLKRLLRGRVLHSWEVVDIVVPCIDGKPFLVGEEAMKQRPWQGRKELNDTWPGQAQARQRRAKYLPK